MPQNRSQPENMAKCKRKWTIDEDEALLRGLEAELARPTGRGNSINWNEIAKRVPLRNNKDCRKRYLNGMAWNLKKGPWSVEEDIQLKELIRRYGTSWVDIARAMGTRSADQCSKRWYHCLNPELDRQPWKNDEIQLLLEAYKIHGSSWKLIQEKYLPARSPNNIRNQYTILTRYNSKTERRPSNVSRFSDTESSSSRDIRNMSEESQLSGDENDTSLLDDPLSPAFTLQNTSGSNMNAAPALPWTAPRFGTMLYQEPKTQPPATSAQSYGHPTAFATAPLQESSFGWPLHSEPLSGGEYCALPQQSNISRHSTYPPYFHSAAAGTSFAALPSSVGVGAFTHQQQQQQHHHHHHPQVQQSAAPMPWTTYNPPMQVVPPQPRPEIGSWASARGSPQPVDPSLAIPYGATDLDASQINYTMNGQHYRR